MSRLFRDVDGGPRCPNGSVVCIGAFDGLHLGHQALVRRTVSRARELGLPMISIRRWWRRRNARRLALVMRDALVPTRPGLG